MKEQQNHDAEILQVLNLLCDCIAAIVSSKPERCYKLLAEAEEILIKWEKEVK